MLKVNVEAPTLEELTRITTLNTEGRGIQLPAPAATRDQVLLARDAVRSIPVAQGLREYVARLILATHPDSELAPAMVKSYVEYGASPRAAIALVMAAKAHAFLAGEIHVRQADIETAFRHALLHRLILNFKGDAEGVSASTILDEVWRKVALV